MWNMERPQRQRTEPTEHWEQLELLFTSPEQRQYELIRPVVLFGQSAAERARETQTAERTLSRHAKRFLEGGMASLFPTSPLRLPPASVWKKAAQPHVVQGQLFS
jgi:hypothetical protein